MKIVVPSEAERLALQRVGGWYYSAGFEVVLRKLGFVPDVRQDGPLACGFVCRQSGWEEHFDDLPLVFEGPLSESVLAAVGIAATPLVAKQLDLLAADGTELGMFAYDHPLVRRIPASNKEVSEPFPFESSDRRWNVKRIEYQALTPEAGDEPLLHAVDEDGTEHVVGLRREGRLLLGVPLLDAMVQHHVPPPYEGASYRSRLVSSDLESAENWLLREAADLFVAGGQPVVRLSRWPDGKRAAFTIRHDYDRPISDDDVDWLLRVYDAHDVKSTWFWLVSTSNPAQVERVRRAGHEVALHTEAGTREEFAAEVGFFREELGFEPAGYTAHGGAGSAGYLGLHQLEWALDSGLLYGELLGASIGSLPHQAVVERDETIVPTQLVVPAQHWSLDIGTGRKAHAFKETLAGGTKVLARGRQLVVMNHPDIHRGELAKVIEQLPLADVWSPTFAELAEWYSAARIRVSSLSAPGSVEVLFDGSGPASERIAVTTPAGQVEAMAPVGRTPASVAAESGRNTVGTRAERT